MAQEGGELGVVGVELAEEERLLGTERQVAAEEEERVEMTRTETAVRGVEGVRATCEKVRRGVELKLAEWEGRVRELARVVEAGLGDRAGLEWRRSEARVVVSGLAWTVAALMGSGRWWMMGRWFGWLTLSWWLQPWLAAACLVLVVPVVWVVRMKETESPREARRVMLRQSECVGLLEGFLTRRKPTVGWPSWLGVVLATMAVGLAGPQLSRSRLGLVVVAVGACVSGQMALYGLQWVVLGWWLEPWWAGALVGEGVLLALHLHLLLSFARDTKEDVVDESVEYVSAFLTFLHVYLTHLTQFDLANCASLTIST